MQSDLLCSSVPTQVACGRDHSLLCGDGRLFGFGNGESGQFGPIKGLVQFQAAEIQLSVIHSTGSRESTMVAVGNKHSLILKDGIVYATGDNAYGRLGLEKTKGKTDGRIRFDKGSVDDKISFITCGPDHSVALSSDGVTLWCWGSCDRVGVGHPAKTKAERLADVKNAHHDSVFDDETPAHDIELEMLEEFVKTPLPFFVFPYDPNDPHRIVQVSCGAQHTIALREDGCVYTW